MEKPKSRCILEKKLVKLLETIFCKKNIKTIKYRLDVIVMNTLLDDVILDRPGSSARSAGSYIKFITRTDQEIALQLSAAQTRLFEKIIKKNFN